MDTGGMAVPGNAEPQEARNWVLSFAARLVPQEPSGWHRYVMPLGVLTLLATWIMLGELDSLLKGMQGADGVSHGMSALTTGSPNQKAETLATWASWDSRNLDLFVPSTEVRIAYVWVDFGFLIAYSVVLLGAIGGLWRRSEPGENDVSPATVSRAKPWLEVINGLGYLLLALVVLDLVENIGLLIWPDPSGVMLVDRLAATAVSWLKIGAGLALIVGIAYVATVAFRPSDVEELASEDTPTKYWRAGTARMRRWVRGWSLFRVPLILLTLVAVLMLAVIPMGFVNQVPDLIRRWTAWHLIVTLVTTGGVVAAVWVVASYAERRYLGRVPRPPRSASLVRTAAWALVGAGVAQSITFFLGVSGWGALVPAVFVVLLALAQWILPGRPESDEDSPRIVAAGTSRVLAAAVMALLGASMLNAAVPELVDPTRVPLSMTLALLLGIAIVGPLAAWVSVVVAGWTGQASTWLADRNAPVGLMIAFGLVIATFLGIVFLPDPASELPLWLSLLFGLIVSYSAVGIYVGLHDPVSKGNGVESDGGISPKQAPTGLYFQMSGAQLQFSPWGKAIGLVAMVCAMGATVWILFDPIVRAPRVGGAAIVMLALAQLAIIGLLLTQFADHAEDQNAFAWLGFKRIPVFLFLFAWIAVVAVVPTLKLDSYHDVRVENEDALPEPATLPAEALSNDQAACLSGIEESPSDVAYVFERWVCINVDPSAASDTDAAAVPLFIVSSWGGGIRAGVWASLVMDCLFEAGTQFEDCQSLDPGADGDSASSSNSDRILGLSGVSGGALGFLEYAAHVADRTTGEPVNPEWVGDRLGDDYVSPVLAWMLYMDMPLHLLGFVDRLPDRADVLEEAWERSWGEGGTLSQGLVSLWRSNPRVPTVLANGTSFSDGCGFVSAPIAGASRSSDGVDDCRSLLPGTSSSNEIGSFVGSKDLIPYLCGGERDVRLSTAALLSARFPFVTPSGRVVRDCSGTVDEISYVIDGGYREGSGALTALQLWDAIEESVWDFNADNSVKIVPFMIHIENGYSPPTPQPSTPPVPNEWLVPVQGRVGNGLVTVSRGTAAARFNEPVRSGSSALDCTLDDDPLGGRYVFITTRAHPGVSAPLGWTLSKESYVDLERQLGVNGDGITQVQSWLNGPLMCSAAEVPGG